MSIEDIFLKFTMFFDKQLAIINDPRVPQKDRDATLAFTVKFFNDMKGMLQQYERKHDSLADKILKDIVEMVEQYEHKHGNCNVGIEKIGE